MNSKKDVLSSDALKKMTCGVIMPIAELDDCPKEHWSEVYDIIKIASKQVGIGAKLVSEAKHVGVIQKQIVNNLYANEVVVCDVSGRNPNVMLELGLRLAFNKPVIIVKDDITPYSFDTSPVQHLEYPRTLRHSAIEEFQAELGEKILASINGGIGQSFLDSFGDFKVAQIDVKNAPLDEVLLEEVRSLRLEVSQIRASQPEIQIPTAPRRVRPRARKHEYIIIDGRDKVYRGSELINLVEAMQLNDPVEAIEIDEDGDVKAIFAIELEEEARQEAVQYIFEMLKESEFVV